MIAGWTMSNPTAMYLFAKIILTSSVVPGILLSKKKLTCCYAGTYSVISAKIEHLLADNWSEKACRRRTQGVGRMRYMKKVFRRFRYVVQL